MHMLIAVLADVSSKADALSQAEGVAERLCERGTFDSYAMNGEGLAGRWRTDFEATPVKSDKGQALLQELQEDAKARFLAAIHNLRAVMEGSTDEQWWNAEETSGWRVAALRVGEFEGPEVPLYDEDGNGLRTPCEVKDALAGKPKRERWIVPVDMHY